MLAISLITDIDVNLIFYVENKKRIYNYLYNTYKNDNEIRQFLNSYYVGEMNKNKWIVLKDKKSLVQTTIDLLDYMSVKDFNILDKYLEKRILYKKSNEADMKKVYLWIRHCEKIIEKQDVNEYDSSKLNLLLEELKNERNKEFNEEKLISIFNKYGIYLSIEDALKGTKIRGCMMIKDTNPVIFMTKYLKEKSDFYYALYHEIGHIKTDYNKAKNKIIVSDEEIETKADDFALNQMINIKIWNNILSDFTNKEKICKDNLIPLSFLYSRLAYEGYIKYSIKEYNSHKERIF